MLGALAAVALPNEKPENRKLIIFIKLPVKFRLRNVLVFAVQANQWIRIRVEQS